MDAKCPQFPRSCARGFTMFEMLLSVAILGVLASLLIPVSVSLQNKSNLTTATQTVAVALRNAQSLAQGGNGDDVWGVHLETGSAIIFRGDVYVENSSYNDERTFSSSITPTGDNDIVFENITGELVSGTEATLTLTNPEGDSNDIVINQKGFVSF